MPVDKLANMDEKLWILEDLNMMYIRQIALSLQVTLLSSLAQVGFFLVTYIFILLPLFVLLPPPVCPMAVGSEKLTWPTFLK